MPPLTQENTADELDRFDEAIISALAADARASIVDLAPKVGLSATACARRLKSLEERGIISGYHAALEPKRLGFGVTVIVRIALDSQREDAFEAFERAVVHCAPVVRCHLMSGDDDYLLIVLCRDIADYEHIYKSQLARLPRVARIQSSFAMRDIIDRTLSNALFAASPAKRKSAAGRRRST
jgi:DNA-binding Lrp family transcriptional regulator